MHTDQIQSEATTQHQVFVE